MMTQCRVCHDPLSGGEDELNDGLCDWCAERQEERETRDWENGKKRIAELLAAENKLVSRTR